ncbi:MAG: sulfite exporter TauE/SafE family protein [Bacteroidales bacterium]|nr:sulfite exporter TauE/SafE family protein [Bacteroidales bacterium]
MVDSFILGLSTGSACLLTCGMVMFPYLLAGSADVWRITADLSIFFLTRLTVYFLLATASWYFGQVLFMNPVVKSIVPGILYIVFAVMLIWYSISRKRQLQCPSGFVTTIDNRRLIPILLGVVNSIGFCPALFIILTKGASESTLVQSYKAFLAFFIGSSLWFLPLPLAGKIRKKKVLQTIGILATGLAGIIFIIKGITSLIGGLINE